MLTRTLEYVPPGAAQPRAITVSAGTPERDPLPGGDFRVRIEVTGFDEPYASFVHGVDPIQALLMALWLVPALLGTLAGRGGQVTWLGSDDLGFRYAEPPRDAAAP